MFVGMAMSRGRLDAMSPAFVFVLTMGIVNLFADTTYEGGASINGPFLGTLGASAAMISVIAGLGEFLGYSLRAVSGYVSDKTGRYWLVTFVGYVVNLLAVPAMALAGGWPMAAGFVLAERVGRAMRKPTVEAMLSYTTDTLGTGWVYALNTALDETGATIGPLVVALVLFANGTFRTAYALLLVSALLALVALTGARLAFPVPSRLERESTARATTFGAAYWLYTAGGACFAAGLMSFEFLSYHLSASGTITAQWLPVVLAASTAFGVVASLVLGRLFDRLGTPVVLAAVGVASTFAPSVLLGSRAVAVAGMLLWGVGYATQDTLLKAVIAGVLPEGRRNLAFGLFYTGYGSGWLVGSTVAGLLYAHSRLAVAVFSVLVQLASVPFFAAADRRRVART